MKLTFIAALFALLSSYSYACSCVPLSLPAEAVAKANSVFSGRVTEVKKEMTTYGTERLRVSFEVADFWKGLSDWHTKMDITTAGHSAACGLNLEVGKDYLIYASLNLEGQLSSSICTRSTLLEFATEDLDFLNPIITE